MRTTKPVAAEAPPVETTTHLSPHVPSVFSDTMMISCRTDGLVCLNFLCRIPGDINSEQARIFVTTDHARRIAEVITRTLAKTGPPKL